MQRNLKVNSNNAFTYHWMIWKFLGLQAPKALLYKVPYIVATATLNILVTILFPIPFVVSCFLSTSLAAFCESFFITSTDVLCSIKFIKLFFDKRKLESVKEILVRLDARAQTAEEVEILQGEIKVSHRFFFGFLANFIVVNIASQSSVIFSKERKLMYASWYPFDWQNSYRTFVCLHVYQTFALLTQVMQDLTIDTYPQAYLSILSGHMRTLALRTSRVGWDRNKTKYEHYRDLVQCVEDHLVILDLLQTIQEVISFTSLAQFVGSGMAQCTIGIYVLYIDVNLSEIMNAAFFFFVITTEIFILCYFGDRFKQECDNLVESIYFCNWIEQDTQFKKAMLIMLIRSQNYKVIFAGNIIPLCLSSFLQVLKSSYSVFAILRKMK